MQSVRTLFKLDLKSRYGISPDAGKLKKFAQFGNMLFFVLVYAVLVVGIYYLSNVFVTRSGLRIEFLVIIATFTIALATIISTSTVIKNLYQNGDNEMLLRFPVSGKEILVAKSVYCYLHNLVTCLLTMLPFYISFGVVTHASVGDYFAYIGIVLLSTFLPFFIANIIAVPVMKVMNLVKNQFLLVLIFTIIVVCAVFVFYLVSLSNVLKYLKNSNQTIFSADMIARYKHFAQNAYPFNWYAEIINGRKYAGLSSGQYALRFLYMFLINGALGVGAYFVTTREYYKTILYGIETQKASFKKKIKDVVAEAAKEVGAPVELKAFVRFALGEGIEKKQEDFAAEVLPHFEKFQLFLPILCNGVRRSRHGVFLQQTCSVHGYGKRRRKHYARSYAYGHRDFRHDNRVVCLDLHFEGRQLLLPHEDNSRKLHKSDSRQIFALLYDGYAVGCALLRGIGRLLHERGGRTSSHSA